MVAKTAASDKPRIYGLDRIKELRRIGRSYKIPKKFTAKGYFKDLYGACIEDSKYAEEVEIKVDKSQVYYFNSLKLHESQTPIEETSDYTIFRYHIVPTYDFTQELLSKSDSIEILKPQWYRDEIKNTIQKMLKRYED